MLHTYFISLDASVTITENKSAEPNTENESVEAITENERAENYPPERMLADLKYQNIIYRPDASREGKEMKANQPRNYSYHKRKFGKDERSFLPSWYEKWNWLHYSKAEDSVYYIICTNVYHHNMINDIKVENSFVKTGHSNWKNARSNDKGFHQHDTSKCHQQAIQKLTEVPKSTKDVATVFKTNMTETQHENRTSSLKIISCLRYLAHQGIPFRGHGDEKDPNFKQLIRFCAEDDPAFAKWLKEKSLSYTSPEIQNEILKDMSLSILRDVVNCIKIPDFFSIMVDKTSDVSNREHVAFCAR